jgi:hypothetical protein
LTHGGVHSNSDTCALHDDARELEELAAASKRAGVQVVLRVQAAALRRKAEEISRGIIKKPARGNSNRGAGWGAHGGKKEREKLVVVARGTEGFALINFAKEWADLPVLELRESGLEGVYHDLVYGFDVTVDKNQAITSWGSSRGNRRVKVGPYSAMTFVRKVEFMKL